jgi:CRISPR-associated protein Cas2
MLAIVVENAPPRLRGRLSLWLVEVRAGTYVGAYGRRTRERIWNDVTALIGDGNATMAWSHPSDAGFSFASVGHDRRECIMLDGMPLVRFSSS